MFSQQIIAKNRARVEAQLGLELKEYSLSEVEEWGYRLRGLTDLGTLDEEAQRYVVNELHMSKLSFRYWAARYCTIMGVDKQHTTFRNLWPSQEKLLLSIANEEEKRKKIKIVLLKSRQIGGTAIGVSILAHMAFFTPNTQGISASDHPDNTLNVLWHPMMRIYENLPWWMRPLMDARPKAQNLHFPDISCDIVYGSGNQKTTLGQGMTVDIAHLTEVSSWIPECTIGIDSDLMPAFDSSEKHHSFLLLESTGAGARGNWFHDQFDAASRGLSAFKPVFIAWYLRPGWSQSAEGVTMEEETLSMAERVKTETGIELSKGQLSWWQQTKNDKKAKDLLEVFYQEHPSTVDEAFQTGLRSVFSIEARARTRDGLKKPIIVYDFEPRSKKWILLDVDDWLNLEREDKYEWKLIIWEGPRAGSIYVVGVDASYGITGGDNAAVEVLRVGTVKEPDEQVAEWAGPCDPLTLADVCWKVGHYYRDKVQQYPAMMAIEVNPGSPGIVTQTELMRKQYPHFYVWRRPLRIDGRVTREVGWMTNRSTRPLLTERGVNAVKKKDLLINSVPFVGEMGSFVDHGRPGERHYEHASGYHDDRIIALFIAHEVAHADDMASVADQRRRFVAQKKEPVKEAVQFSQLGLTWEEAMEKWEKQVDLDGLL
ncbi:MAG: hypothetical protein ACREIQ_08340 [Nitrospiria bacterium]